jgi:hypothetical protein
MSSCAATPATGEVLWKLRLKGPFWATPVAAGEHLYFFNQEGIGQVVRLGPEGTLVAENELGTGARLACR